MFNQDLDDLADRLINRYKKAGKIGKGTYGVVYKAKDTETGDTVALKKMILIVITLFI